jgi:hypothetical protein
MNSFTRGRNARPFTAGKTRAANYSEPNLDFKEQPRRRFTFFSLGRTVTVSGTTPYSFTGDRFITKRCCAGGGGDCGCGGAGDGYGRAKGLRDCWKRIGRSFNRHRYTLLYFKLLIVLLIQRRVFVTLRHPIPIRVAPTSRLIFQMTCAALANAAFHENCLHY